MEKREQCGLEFLPLSGHGEAESQAAARLGVVPLRQRHAIEGLRAGIVAHQIEGEAAIGSHLGFGDAGLRGFREQAQGFDRAALQGEAARKAEHDAAVLGRHILSAHEESDRRVEIADRQRSFARIEQRAQIAWQAGETAQRIVEIPRSARRKGLDDGLGGDGSGHNRGSGDHSRDRRTHQGYSLQMSQTSAPSSASARRPRLPVVAVTTMADPAWP